MSDDSAMDSSEMCKYLLQFRLPDTAKERKEKKLFKNGEDVKLSISDVTVVRSAALSLILSILLFWLLTAECSSSKGLRASYLSTCTKFYAGQNA